MYKTGWDSIKKIEERQQRDWWKGKLMDTLIDKLQNHDGIDKFG